MPKPACTQFKLLKNPSIDFSLWQRINIAIPSIWPSRISRPFFLLSPSPIFLSFHFILHHFISNSSLIHLFSLASTLHVICFLFLILLVCSFVVIPSTYEDILKLQINFCSTLFPNTRFIEQHTKYNKILQRIRRERREVRQIQKMGIDYLLLVCYC